MVVILTLDQGDHDDRGRWPDVMMAEVVGIEFEGRELGSSARHETHEHMNEPG